MCVSYFWEAHIEGWLYRPIYLAIQGEAKSVYTKFETVSQNRLILGNYILGSARDSAPPISTGRPASWRSSRVRCRIPPGMSAHGVEKARTVSFL